MDDKRLLEVTDLKVHFRTDEGIVKAVDGVSFHIDKGETLAVVGESGSGKSVTSLAIMRLISMPPGKIAGGQILFRDKDGKERELINLPEPSMRKIRGNNIAIIFQEPMTSLNPVYSIGDQIAEAITLHQGKSRKEAWSMSADMLDLVGIPEPKKRLSNYPHQMSGGMRQRVMVAMALSCNPGLLIADEPTTALDVTIQAQILELIKKLQDEIGMSVLFITHNLGVVAEVADRVVVMYAGRAVEEADVVPVYKSPRHPYTMGLLNSVPRLDLTHNQQDRLEAIPGNVPNPLYLPSGCAFHPRCRYAKKGICDAEVPSLVDSGGGHMVRCVRWQEIQGELA